jgi:hypothetical protein
MRDEKRDARAVALASYLRERAAALSMSADVNDEQHIAAVGLALLDAAKLAEQLAPDDPRLALLSEAGCFETMPRGTALFIETPALRAAVQRPLAGPPVSGSDILGLIVTSRKTD